jgi:hypothetical protein
MAAESWASSAVRSSRSKTHCADNDAIPRLRIGDALT